MAQERADGGRQHMNNACGEIQKNDFRLRGGFTETLLLEKVAAEILQGGNILDFFLLQSAPVLKALCVTRPPTNYPWLSCPLVLYLH